MFPKLSLVLFVSHAYKTENISHKFSEMVIQFWLLCAMCACEWYVSDKSLYRRGEVRFEDALSLNGVVFKATISAIYLEDIRCAFIIG